SAQTQIDILTKQLRDSESKLDEARNEIRLTREENTKEFKAVLNQQTDALQTTVRELRDASIALHRGIKQSNIKIGHFFVHAFVEPIPREGDDSLVNNGAVAATHEYTAKRIYCALNLPRLFDLAWYVQLTSNPALYLRFGFHAWPPPKILDEHCTIT